MWWGVGVEMEKGKERKRLVRIMAICNTNILQFNPHSGTMGLILLLFHIFPEKLNDALN